MWMREEKGDLSREGSSRLEVSFIMGSNYN